MKRQPKKTSQPPAPMASTKGDLRQLKQNSGATVAELKAFLKELKGKSPQEMLGLVAGSQLIRAICLSTALVTVAAVVFTAVPFALGAGKDKKDADEASATEKNSPAPRTPAPSQPAIPPAADPNQPAPAVPDFSKLGIEEEKTAPPNENPLENKKDDFLKGLD